MTSELKKIPKELLITTRAKAEEAMERAKQNIIKLGESFIKMPQSNQ